MLLFEELTDAESELFMGFFINCLQFLDVCELIELLPDFMKEFENLINPTFKLLYYKFEERETSLNSKE